MGFLAHFVAVILFVSLASSAITRLLFAHDLRSLKRTEIDAQWKLYYDPTAHQAGRCKMASAFLGSLLFVMGGVYAIKNGAYLIGIITVTFFGLCMVVAALALSVRNSEASRRPDKG